jgi:lysophospholipase L1-like esterase
MNTSTFRTTPEDPTRCENDILAFEAQDRLNPPAKGGIVFVGSSSFTLWHTLADDLAPLPVLNRGFGGSLLSDSVHYYDRLVTKHQPRAVVVYAGENDIGQNFSGAHVSEQLKQFVANVHSVDPDIEIFAVSIKPSPGRGEGIHQIRVANQLSREWIQDTPKVTYIDVVEPMLGADGIGRAELFVEDGVHLTSAGYELWTSIIKPYLEPLYK